MTKKEQLLKLCEFDNEEIRAEFKRMSTDVNLSHSSKASWAGHMAQWQYKKLLPIISLLVERVLECEAALEWYADGIYPDGTDVSEYKPKELRMGRRAREIIATSALDAILKGSGEG